MWHATKNSLTISQIPWLFQVYRIPWQFPVFQVCGNPEQLQTQKSSTESMQTTMITANKDKHGQWHTTTDGSRMSTAYIVSESLRSSFSRCWMTVESRWYCSARLCRPSIMLLSDRSSSTSVNASLMSRSTWRPLINNADSPAARPSDDSKYYKVHTTWTTVCNDIMTDTHDST